MNFYRKLEIFFIHLATASREIRLPKPGLPIVGLQERLPDMKGFRYPVAFPAIDPVDSDVSTRELTIDIDGVATVLTTTVDEASVKFDAKANANVTLTLVHIDDSGLRSQPSEPVSFVAIDQVPPHQPGAMNIGTPEQIDIPE